MTWEQSHSDRRVFEVSVAGEIGPVLENALMPGVSSREQVVTIVRTRSADEDVVDMLDRLEAKGIAVLEIALAAPELR